MRHMITAHFYIIYINNLQNYCFLLLHEESDATQYEKGKVITDTYLTKKNCGDIRVLNFFIGRVSRFTFTVSIRGKFLEFYFACANYHENIDK